MKKRLELYNHLAGKDNVEKLEVWVLFAGFLGFGAGLLTALIFLA